MLPMTGAMVSIRSRIARIAALLALAVVAGGLAGCGTVNEKLANGMGDYVPQWAGGLPADAPPRPGTAKYDAYMKELERRRQMPAAKREELENTESPAIGPVH